MKFAKPIALACAIFAIGLISLGQGFPSWKRDSPPIARIEIQGNEHTPEQSIRGRIFSQAKRPLDRKTVSRDLHAIYQMGVFEKVTAKLSKDDKGATILVYEVKEKNINPVRPGRWGALRLGTWRIPMTRTGG